jgi:multiple sugar transport system permease protein
MSEKVSAQQAPKLRKDMTKWQWTLREMKIHKAGYFMVAPYYLIFMLFTVVPVVVSLLLSFTQFNMLEMPIFVGLDNYIRLLLDDDIFLKACSNTLIFATMTGPVSYLLCLMFAWFINELTPRIRAVVTLIFYAPSISGQVYLIWQTLFSSDQYGWVNGTLMKLGVISSPILWFQDTNYIMGLVIMVALWTSLGTSFLSFIAGFQVVDKSLYEAAAVDGIKNRWQELWYVTLPVMKNQMMFAAIMSITGSFGFGAVVTALCGFPSVDYAAHTIMHHLEDYGSQRWEVGYASAIATILFAIMIGANVLVNRMLSKVGK